MILKNGQVLIDGALTKADIKCTGNTITSIGSRSYDDADILDCSGLYIFPGFIDVHVHGGGGGDSCIQTKESYNSIVKNAVKHGTTSVVLAIGGMQDDFVHDSADLVYETNKASEGATILGLHLEGPWVNEKKAGAIPKKHLDSECSLHRAHSLVDGYEDIIKIVTLAPELNNSSDLIKYLAGLGIVVSLGHSAATIEEASTAFENGAKSITHLFNASTPISGRDPGLVGFAMTNNTCFCEIIADGQHVHPENVRLAAKTIKNRLIAMTDAIEVTGTDATQFELPGIGPVYVHDGRTWGPGNSIMGSVLTQDQALRNMLNWNIDTLPNIIKMFTENPAKLLNIYPSKGCIKTNSTADFTVMDKEFNVIYTVVGGKKVYEREL